MPRQDDRRRLGCAWYLTGVCNYACPYCYYPTKPTRHPEIRMTDVRAVFGSLAEARGEIDIALTGGEPSLHPLFVDLLRYFSDAGHRLLVSTNLSCGAGPFLRGVPEPARCTINASFHPSHADMASFGPEVRRLLDAGFPVRPSYVLYPPQVEARPTYEAALREHAPQAALEGMAFAGEYEGRTYPQKPTGEGTCTAPPEQARRGRPCRAGCDYFAILADGTITRCVSGCPLRGEKWPSFELSTTPAPCPLDECLCVDMHHLWVSG
jgi:hypothetical protein